MVDADSLMETRLCTRCNTEKSLDQFYAGSQRPCKDCDRTRRREHARQNPNQGRNSKLKNRYDISLEQFNTLVQAQGGKCGICGETPERGLVVDHDHETDRVRALLCDHCNLALGLYDDNPTLLRRAASYLEAHRCGEF